MKRIFIALFFGFLATQSVAEEQKDSVAKNCLGAENGVDYWVTITHSVNPEGKIIKTQKECVQIHDNTQNVQVVDLD